MKKIKRVIARSVATKQSPTLKDCFAPLGMTSADNPHRVAYITGASRGLGLRVAELLAGRYRLGLGYRHTAPESLTDSIALEGDVGDPSTSERAVSLLMKRFGRLDLFVANAAITIDKPLIALRESDWDDVIATNLSGVFYGLRACAEAVMASGGSAVVVSSIMGRRGSGGSASYAASKAALFGLAFTAAREWAPLARVNVVVPGYMPTDMGTAIPSVMDSARSEHLCGSLTDINDAARLIVTTAELASVTGQIFTADGRISPW